MTKRKNGCRVSASGIQTLSVSQIRLDFQPRENLDPEIVQTYIARLQDGKSLDNIVVRFDGENYYLQDGFHRLEAARRLGASEIRVEVLPGTLADMEAEFKTMLRGAMKTLDRESKQS